MAKAIKAVIKLEVNGERPASIAKKMGVGTLKVIMPFKCISEHFKHTASQNKSKAMQIAVGFEGEITTPSLGVNSAGLEGEGKEELVVKGVFDPVKLVTELREKVGGASIKSVGPEEDKKAKEKKEEEEREKLAKIISSSSVYPWPHHQPLIFEIPSPRGCFF